MEKDIYKIRDYCWNYFEYHSRQQMLIIHYYILISGGIIAAVLASSLAGKSCPLLLFVASIFLSLITLVFWKLDKRTAYLIKHSEIALKKIEMSLEKDIAGVACDAKLFSDEEESFKKVRATRFYEIDKLWSYRHSFKILFSSIIFLCIVTFIFSLYLLK